MLMALAAVPAAAPATVRAGIQAWQQGDHATAVAIWRALADKGDNDAAFNLGQAYRLGKGVNADSGEAKKWFERAAKAGHLDAQVSLGLLLFDTGDRATALTWLKRAADRGEPRALLVTGTALFNGDGMKRDPVLGYAYVSRAAAQGLAPAKATLAEMDNVMPLEERKKGVALAQSMVAAKPVPGPVKKAVPKLATPTPPAAPIAIATATAAARGVWRVQLGAFSTRVAAEGLFRKLSATPALAGRQPYYVAVGAITRLQAGPFESRASASAACAKLRPQACFAVEAR
jgi:TPR repeat protein